MPWPHFLCLALTLITITQCSNPGQSNCRCISPNQINVSQSETNIKDCLLVQANDKYYCYPTDYGAGQCKNWDSGLQPYCNRSNWDFCEDEWCFVDPHNCALPFKPSRYFATPTYYSYITCDSHNNFTVHHIQTSLSHRIIRMAIPSPEVPYVFLDQSGQYEGGIHHNGQRYVGAMVDLAVDMFKAANVSYLVYNVSPASSVLFPLSPYTACVHSVSMGLVDMCVGALWETAQRHLMSAFGNVVFQDTLVLLEKKDAGEQKTVAELAALIFKPFTVGLWVSIFATVVLFGLLIYVHERWVSNRLGLTVVDSVYLSLSTLLSGPSVYTSSGHTGGRSLMLGLAVFVLVIIETYAAQLTTFLVMANTKSAQMQSLEDAVVKNQAICILQALEQVVVAEEPRVKPLLRLYSTTMTTLEGLKRDECAAALIAEFHAKKVEDGRYGSCDCTCTGFQASPVPVAMVPIAFPMSDALVETFGYWQRHLLEQKSFTQYLQQYQTSAACTVPNQSDPEANKLGVGSLLGLWFVCLGFFMLWCSRCTYRRCQHWRAPTPEPVNESDLHPREVIPNEGEEDRDTDTALGGTAVVTVNSEDLRCLRGLVQQLSAVQTCSGDHSSVHAPCLPGTPPSSSRQSFAVCDHPHPLDKAGAR